MKTRDELKAKHAKELADLEQTERILADLAGCPHFAPESVSVYIHDAKHASVKLWPDFRTEHKLAEACEVVEHFRERIVIGEHWNAGCTSTRPAEINTVFLRDKNSVMDGSHAVEIQVNGGRGFGPNVTIEFWTKLGGVLCEIECPVSDLWKLVPRVEGRYTQEGDFRGKVEWNPAETQTCDKFRKFWSEPPAYHGSYYLADVPNFEAWASTHGEQKPELITA